jgi:hypothetical protein
MTRCVEESINNNLVTKQGYERDILAFAEGQKLDDASGGHRGATIAGVMRFVTCVFI